VADLGLGLPPLAEAKRVQESEDDRIFVPSLTANYDLGDQLLLYRPHRGWHLLGLVSLAARARRA